MKSASVVLLALLCAACQQQPETNAPETNSSAGKETAASAPKPGDKEYIAEDPRLAQLVGQPGPAIQLAMVDGTKIDLKKLYGPKPVYLKLWATYCIPCRAQMPGFEKVYETYGDQMEVIAVNAGVGDDPGKVKAFGKQYGLRMPLAIDDGALGAWIKLQETPLHIIIGRDGRVIHAGHQEGPRLDAAIQTALGSKTGPITTTDVATITALKPGDVVPAMTLRDGQDQPIAFKPGPTGRPRAILFSSIWCESYLKDTEPQTVPKCALAREEVDRLARTNGVEWLGVMNHLWTSPTSLVKYATKKNPRIPLAVDTDGTAFRTFGVRRFPAVALIDKEGRLVRLMGPEETDIAGAVAALTKS